MKETFKENERAKAFDDTFCRLAQQLQAVV